MNQNRKSSFATKARHKIGEMWSHLPFIRTHRPPSRNAFPIISQSKTNRIKALCDSLLHDKEILNSGKIQFLNFSGIKEYLGPKWDRLEPIILNITQDVLTKYTDPQDIFFRYTEEDFLILFSKSSLKEAEL